MNYYIQGDEANADKIRAAFKKLGYDTSGHLFNANSVLYFTLDGEIRATTCNCTPAIIKTHPDYKELELPVEPKFKVGDWLYPNCNGIYPVLVTDYNKCCGYQLQEGSDRCHLSTKIVEDKYHLWTIADAKDGDVLVYTLSGTRAVIILFRCINANDSINAYCGWNGYTFRVTTDGLGYGTLSSTQYVPATKEQRDLLFKKMKEAGYTWDEKKKELKKIQHYDIANLKPFDKVLVRQNDSSTWGMSFFGRYSGMFMCCSNVWFEQCIPFNDDTKHLLGTTDMCDEQYINW